MLIFSVVIFVFSTLTLWLSSLPWTGDIAAISLHVYRLQAASRKIVDGVMRRTPG